MSSTKIVVEGTVAIDSNELEFSFIRASGPGGQNVNKVSSAVQLRFDVAQSSSLTNEVKDRLLRLAGQRATRDGAIIIEAKRYRTQAKNKGDAIERLVALIAGALHVAKPRKKSRPKRSDKQKRLENKKKRGTVKIMRRNPSTED